MAMSCYADCVLSFAYAPQPKQGTQQSGGSAVISGERPLPRPDQHGDEAGEEAGDHSGHGCCTV